MQFCDSLQFFNLNLSSALWDATSGMIFISAFRPLDNLIFNWLPLPSLLKFNLVLIVFPFSFISRISSLIRFNVMFLFASMTSSLS